MSQNAYTSYLQKMSLNTSDIQEWKILKKFPNYTHKIEK